MRNLVSFFNVVLFVFSLMSSAAQASWIFGADDKGDIRPFDTPLSVNTAHKNLAIGDSVAVGVKEDGTVWSWGSTNEGELGDGLQYSKKYVPSRLEGMTDFIEVAGTDSHFLALRKDGTVWSWGSNEDGQLGYKTEKRFSAFPQQIGKLQNIISIAAASGHSLALDNKGRVWAFGSNNTMQLAISPKDNSPHYEPQIAFSENSAVKVLAYAGTSGVLTFQGVFYYWGANVFMQKYMDMSLPKKYEFPSEIADVSIGGAINILAKDGYVWVQSGNNFAGELGQGDFKNYGNPMKVKNIGRIKSITTNTSSSAALDEAGRIWQWGGNVRIPPIPSVQHNKEPMPILIGKFNNAQLIEGSSTNAVLLVDGQVYFWGWNRGGVRGTGKAPVEQVGSGNWMNPEKSLWTWK